VRDDVPVNGDKFKHQPTAIRTAENVLGGVEALPVADFSPAGTFQQVFIADKHACTDRAF
jgi:hypothetical protein